MGRKFLAVLAGAVVWAVLWIGGNQILTALLPEVLRPGEPITSMPVLVGFIAYSVLLSVLAGWTTGRIGRHMGTVWVLAGIQLVLGIIAEVSYWALTPVWYHLVFLALVVPATVWGGRLAAAPARLSPA